MCCFNLISWDAVFLKWGVPLNHRYFHRIFHEINHPLQVPYGSLWNIMEPPDRHRYGATDDPRIRTRTPSRFLNVSVATSWLNFGSKLRSLVAIWANGSRAQTLPKRYPNATQWVIVIAGFSGWSFPKYGNFIGFDPSPCATIMNLTDSHHKACAHGDPVGSRRLRAFKTCCNSVSMSTKNQSGNQKLWIHIIYII